MERPYAARQDQGSMEVEIGSRAAEHLAGAGSALSIGLLPTDLINWRKSSSLTPSWSIRRRTMGSASISSIVGSTEVVRMAFISRMTRSWRIEGRDHTRQVLQTNDGRKPAVEIGSPRGNINATGEAVKRACASTLSSKR